MVRFALAALAMLCAMTARAEEPAPVVTQHQIKVDGKTLQYTAEAGRIAIRDVQTGEPHAYMFYTAYRVRSSGQTRPVTFLWGGGPGGASVGMNFNLAGPMVAEGELFDGARLVANDRTWLTATDLVVVDQVGTGFSRPTRPEYAAEFNSTIGDTNSFAEFIRCWLIQHDAEETPVFIGGVSWGAPRAATVGYALTKQGLPLHGVIMITGETSLNKPYISRRLFEALRVVGMAEVARFHHRLSPELGTDRDAIAKAADTWVRNTYVPALDRIDQLSGAERSEIVAGLSRFTGIAPDAIDRKTLIVTPRQFHTLLLKDQDQKLFGFDTRVTTSRPPTSATPAILRHFKYELGYRTDLPYRGLGSPHNNAGFAPAGVFPPGPGENWVYATSPVPEAEANALMVAAVQRGGGPPTVGTPLPATDEAVQLNPNLKFLIILGRYDGESTCPANAELERNLPPYLRQAMTFKCYESGHTPWRTPGVGLQFANDARAFIRSASKTP
ncbi:hypothetical protein ACFPN2_02540 [Steroidobacter flavus]|uniref:Serine carboxypeptidase n=1 Tax=Steroidobacter flavus TaxID=1842136 RepID=A0ABV8SNH7_9GAMM